ncbi:serine/threonine protein kinase [Luteolibacter luteus]|uniref:Serine/threonine protein kinase n=1 Tax=Luteolibacter luteus TaxID=2728835 RepID=A0A858RPS1_9BACT|nr:serine/threonine-protein kinase [Luteolibacter luteus]QJE98621.1 serine/threonine protein kinase [Luteolibacter luteus]
MVSIPSKESQEPDEGSHEEVLFHELLEIQDPAERAERLASIEDRRQRRDLESLLVVADSPTACLSLSAPVLMDMNESGNNLVGVRIGRYVIESLIGEGGMGVVYQVLQVEPFERRAAMKIVHGGFATPGILARFEKERQILAKLQHPNIAQLHDAGTFSAGAPYFVMELVDGYPVTNYCSNGCLGLEDRLQIFEDICLAILHAHRMGVIHCDIKPGNVLVATIADRPVAKVIDFGIATALKEDSLAKASRTLAGGLRGTPEYMSPEQLANDPAKIDNRTDIYSLGVLLYEIVTDSSPFALEGALPGELDELCRRIKEHEPVPPSARMRFTGKNPAVRARGDLDKVILKALAKQPEERYQDVGDLIADLALYLRNEPVKAAAPSVARLVRRTLRRHRIILVAIAAAIGSAALVGGMRISQARADDRRRELLAEQVRASELRQLVMKWLPELADAKWDDFGSPNVTQAQLLRDISEKNLPTKLALVTAALETPDVYSNWAIHAPIMIQTLVGFDPDEIKRQALLEALTPNKATRSSSWPSVWRSRLFDRRSGAAATQQQIAASIDELAGTSRPTTILAICESLLPYSEQLDEGARASIMNSLTQTLLTTTKAQSYFESLHLNAQPQETPHDIMQDKAMRARILTCFEVFCNSHAALRTLESITYSPHEEPTDVRDFLNILVGALSDGEIKHLFDKLLRDPLVSKAAVGVDNEELEQAFQGITTVEYWDFVFSIVVLNSAAIRQPEAMRQEIVEISIPRWRGKQRTRYTPETIFQLLGTLNKEAFDAAVDTYIDLLENPTQELDQDFFDFRPAEKISTLVLINGHRLESEHRRRLALLLLGKRWHEGYADLAGLDDLQALAFLASSLGPTEVASAVDIYSKWYAAYRGVNDFQEKYSLAKLQDLPLAEESEESERSKKFKLRAKLPSRLGRIFAEFSRNIGKQTIPEFVAAVRRNIEKFPTLLDRQYAEAIGVAATRMDADKRRELTRWVMTGKFFQHLQALIAMKEAGEKLPRGSYQHLLFQDLGNFLPNEEGPPLLGLRKGDMVDSGMMELNVYAEVLQDEDAKQLVAEIIKWLQGLHSRDLRMPQTSQEQEALLKGMVSSLSPLSKHIDLVNVPEREGLADLTLTAIGLAMNRFQVESWIYDEHPYSDCVALLKDTYVEIFNAVSAEQQGSLRRRLSHAILDSTNLREVATLVELLGETASGNGLNDLTIKILEHPFLIEDLDPLIQKWVGIEAGRRFKSRREVEEWVSEKL